MTTNQTIDGIDRETLAIALGFTRHGYKNRTDQVADMQHARDKLRALLDAPAVDSPIPQHFVEACDKFDWTPEEALRFYADGKHFDTDRGRTRILCTGAIASHALKGMGEGYAAMKGIETAAQPQGEPVARHPDAIIEGVMTSVGITHVIYASTVSLKHGEQVKLYAEQPAPVAVVLPQRKHVPDFTLHPMLNKEYTGWNAYDAEFRRLNPWLANDK